MALIDDLKSETDAIVRGVWSRRDGEVVPDSRDVGLGNECVDLVATFLYADLADSTELAIQDKTIASEVVKTYLMGTTRIIRALGGEIRSFDGDRVMGIFFRGAKNTAAAKAALQINYFFTQILEPAFTGYYHTHSLSLSQTVGVDTSKVMVVRSGIRSNNDLVWIGRAPNIAAKLSAIRESWYSSYISETVFNAMRDDSKYGGDPKESMWERTTWAAGEPYGVGIVYRSSWWWEP
jgi:class 3 adenylate cyclase